VSQCRLGDGIHSLPAFTENSRLLHSLQPGVGSAHNQLGQAYSAVSSLGLGFGGGGNTQMGARDISMSSLAGLGMRGTQLNSPLPPVPGILAPRAQTAFSHQTMPHAQQTLQHQDLAGKKTLQENDALSFLSEVPFPEFSAAIIAVCTKLRFCIAAPYPFSFSHPPVRHPCNTTHQCTEDANQHDFSSNPTQPPPQPPPPHAPPCSFCRCAHDFSKNPRCMRTSSIS